MANESKNPNDDTLLENLQNDSRLFDPDGPRPKKSSAQAGKTGPFTLEELDSGAELQDVIGRYVNRIRQLKNELAAMNKADDSFVNDYLMQNLELISINQNLEKKVSERTRDLEQANEKLRELGESKETLMHMIVHDMKNPLTAMLGTLQLFQRNAFDLKPEIIELLRSSHTHGVKLLSMIEEILVISRMHSKEFQLKPEQADLIAALRQCQELMQKTIGPRDLTIRFDPPVKDLVLALDVQVIERVTNNLLNNAIKYAKPGSEITLAIDPQPEWVEVSVTNWGEAIPAEFQQRIFELFCRVNKQDQQFSGTGLGLTFCKLAVEAHGGTIQVISPVPPETRGARFIYRIPRLHPNVV